MKNILVNIGIFREFETEIKVDEIILNKELNKHIDSWTNFYSSLLIPIKSNKNKKKYIGRIKNREFSFSLNPFKHKLTDIFSNVVVVENKISKNGSNVLTIKTLIKGVSYLHLTIFLIIAVLSLGLLLLFLFIMFFFPLDDFSQIFIVIFLDLIIFYFLVFNPVRKSLKRIEPLKIELQEFYKGIEKNYLQHYVSSMAGFRS